MRFIARDAEGRALADETWLSVGGGFIIRDGARRTTRPRPNRSFPIRFAPGPSFWRAGARAGLSIAELMRANEAALRPQGEVDAHVERVLDVMFACIDRGLAQSGPLPGGLKVMRRAKAIHDRLIGSAQRNFIRAHEIMDFVSVYAMAVNEENAAGGRVVTAPTNGAAGRHSGGAALLPRPLRGRDPGGHGGLPADRDRDRRAVQAQRLDFGRGGRLPGRGRRRLVDGGGGPLRRARRHRTSRSRTPPRSPWSITSA